MSLRIAYRRVLGLLAQGLFKILGTSQNKLRQNWEAPELMPEAYVNGPLKGSVNVGLLEPLMVNRALKRF